MTAEYALKAALGASSEIEVGSAGLREPNREITPCVFRYLKEKGIDISDHKPRLLTHSMLADADLAIAMGLEHRDFVARIFGYQLPLFSEIAYQRIDSMPDIDEMVPGWQSNPGKASAYTRTVMSYIFDGLPGFVSRLGAMSAFKTKL